MRFLSSSERDHRVAIPIRKVRSRLVFHDRQFSAIGAIERFKTEEIP